MELGSQAGSSKCYRLGKLVEWSMHTWVILLPCSRQEAPLPMELRNTFKKRLVASFLSAGRAYSYLLWSTYLKWNSLMFSTVQPEEHFQGQGKSSGSRPWVLSGLQKIVPPAGSKNSCIAVGGRNSLTSTPTLHAMPQCWHVLTTAAFKKHCWCSM